jgi:Uncharacterized protein conserved in bacteria
MGKKRIEDIVEEICKPITDSKGLELIDVEFKKEGSGYILRVVIDKTGGITIDDCEDVSRELDEKLDETDPIEQSYNLEVQSPGERNIKKDREFEYFKDRDVEVKLFEPLSGKKIYTGKLYGLKDNMVSIKLENEGIMEFNREKVASVKLIITF